MSTRRDFIINASGGYDTLRISGGLMSSLRIVPGTFLNNHLLIEYAGFDRLELIDATTDLTIRGVTDADQIGRAHV